ncbi:MAG: transmembrane prediction [Rhodopirellula sp.]|nr:transmembrane prediction [Rhodopirellula sp.]OUX51892.1 MAG: hypothetical protein CBE43_02350 [Rhodopirellula sp. TMED283]
MVCLLFNHVLPRRQFSVVIWWIALALSLVTAAGARYLNAVTSDAVTSDAVTSDAVTSGNPFAATEDPDGFTFVRVRYDSIGGYNESWYRYEGRDWQRWETDYPRAEKNLIYRLNELTSMKIRPDPIVLRLTDDRLLDHPFIFMSDIGWQQLSSPERAGLERYLQRGGFLWVDDFWGQAEWTSFMQNIGALRADWTVRPIPADHPLLTIVYPMKQCPQIPARVFYQQTGMPWDPPFAHRAPTGGVAGVNRVRFMGLFDEQDRLMVVATHNTDIADGWEREGESKEFFERFSIDSYAITINILVYALTH